MPMITRIALRSHSSTVVFNRFRLGGLHAGHAGTGAGLECADQGDPLGAGWLVGLFSFPESLLAQIADVGE